MIQEQSGLVIPQSCGVAAVQGGGKLAAVQGVLNVLKCAVRSVCTTLVHGTGFEWVDAGVRRTTTMLVPLYGSQSGAGPGAFWTTEWLNLRSFGRSSAACSSASGKASGDGAGPSVPSSSRSISE